MCCAVLSHFSSVWLFLTLWTVVCQAPLCLGFSRQEYWSGLPCPPPGDIPDPGVRPESLTSPALASRFFTTSATWEAPYKDIQVYIYTVELPFATTWMDLEGIMRSKISDTEEDRYCRLPTWLSRKESICQCRRHRFDLWVRKMPCRKKWQLTPVFLPGKSHGQRSLVGYNPRNPKKMRQDSATGQHMCVHAKFLQSRWPLCNPMDGSPPGSSVHGILQARILDWIATPFSRESSWPRDLTCVSYVSCIGKQVLYH